MAIANPTFDNKKSDKTFKMSDCCHVKLRSLESNGLRKATTPNMVKEKCPLGPKVA